MSYHKILPLLVLVFSACEGVSLVLKPSTLRISRDGTANFTLNCTLDEDNATGHAELQNEIREVHRMRIAKFENNQWISIVEMDSDWKSPVVQDDLKNSDVSEHFNLVSKYIQARWPMASNSTAGEYSCDLTGYGRNGQSLSFRSPVINVDAEPPITLYDLYKLIKTSENKTETAIENIATIKEAISQTKEEEEDFSTSYYENWLQGTYSLLQPESGCPVSSGAKWTTGWYKLNTESFERNKDKISTAAHMKGPVLSKENSGKFMTQHFCSVTNPSIGRLWPSGSYCIMRFKETSCPTGFGSGYIIWDENTYLSKHSGNSPHLHTSDNVHIYYCCRNDSSSDTAIALPKTKPFYLHRYGGECQHVKGMVVSEEYMVFDTHCCGNEFSGNVPDGRKTDSDIKLELCYYESV